MTAPTSAPRISVVIPTYNSSRYLAETIDSVVAQTHSSWELVVHDDGSSDNTVAIATARAQLDPAGRIRIVADANGGVAAARNRGLANTDPRSEFVIFLDHDDLWAPQALAELVAALDAHAGCVAAHGVGRCIDAAGELVPGDDLEAVMLARHGFRDGSRRPVPLPLDEATTFADLAVQNWLLTPGLVLLRRSILPRVGGFDPTVVPADDWDFGVRVSRCGDIAFVPRCLLLWRRHEGAQSNLSRRWRRAYYQVRCRMLVDDTNTAPQLRAARLGFAHVIQSTATEALHHLRQRRYEFSTRSAASCAYALVRASRAEALRAWRRIRLRVT